MNPRVVIVALAGVLLLSDLAAADLMLRDGPHKEQAAAVWAQLPECLHSINGSVRELADDECHRGHWREGLAGRAFDTGEIELRASCWDPAYLLHEAAHEIEWRLRPEDRRRWAAFWASHQAAMPRDYARTSEAEGFADSFAVVYMPPDVRCVYLGPVGPGVAALIRQLAEGPWQGESDNATPPKDILKGSATAQAAEKSAHVDAEPARPFANKQSFAPEGNRCRVSSSAPFLAPSRPKAVPRSIVRAVIQPAEDGRRSRPRPHIAEECLERSPLGADADSRAAVRRVKLVLGISAAVDHALPGAIFRRAAQAVRHAACAVGLGAQAAAGSHPACPEVRRSRPPDPAAIAGAFPECLLSEPIGSHIALRRRARDGEPPEPLSCVKRGAVSRRSRRPQRRCEHVQERFPDRRCVPDCAPFEEVRMAPSCERENQKSRPAPGSRQLLKPERDRCFQPCSVEGVAVQAVFGWLHRDADISRLASVGREQQVEIGLTKRQLHALSDTCLMYSFRCVPLGGVGAGVAEIIRRLAEKTSGH